MRTNWRRGAALGAGLNASTYALPPPGLLCAAAPLREALLLSLSTGKEPQIKADDQRLNAEHRTSNAEK